MATTTSTATITKGVGSTRLTCRRTGFITNRSIAASRRKSVKGWKNCGKNVNRPYDTNPTLVQSSCLARVVYEISHPAAACTGVLHVGRLNSGRRLAAVPRTRRFGDRAGQESSCNMERDGERPLENRLAGCRFVEPDCR